MALIKSEYLWKGLTISPYAKVVSRTIKDFMVDGVKQYSCEYVVRWYTNDEKAGEMMDSVFQFTDGEIPTLAMCYDNLKTQEGYEEWTNS